MKFDVLIVGAGLAGLRAAIELKGKCECAVICKTYPNLAHSGEAQGGINAAINPKDNWKDHAYDTVYGSDFLADQDAVEVLCQDAPRVIKELVEFGVNFSKASNGSIAQRPFGAQRFIRTAYAADRTGHALLHSLYKKAQELGVQFFNETQLISLITKNNGSEARRINGALVLDMASGEFRIIYAKSIIIATGGAGRIYGKTTNPNNSGDGIAVAFNAGAHIMDMEMMQFHPTTLTGCNKLLSEAARGEGAYLINSKGERFMKKYAPEKLELASRDVVSRAEATEIKNGFGVGSKKDSVYLDFRHLDKEIVMSKVPDIRRNGIELVGIDILKDPIPVQPGQHYTMGGIATDIDCNTNISGLFAAGECASVSVHGANRLGGNSLMETLVFGRRAGVSALNYIKKTTFDVFDEKTVYPDEDYKVKEWTKNENGKMPREIRFEMGKIMDELVGPFRQEKELLEAKEKIAKLRNEKIWLSEHNGIFNLELTSIYELNFMLDLASCIIESAILRKESRGAHYRTDYPKRDDKNFLKHILCTKKGVKTEISYRPVKLTHFKIEERKY